MHPAQTYLITTDLTKVDRTRFIKQINEILEKNPLLQTHSKTKQQKMNKQTNREKQQNKLGYEKHVGEGRQDLYSAPPAWGKSRCKACGGAAGGARSLRLGTSPVLGHGTHACVAETHTQLSTDVGTPRSRKGRGQLPEVQGCLGVEGTQNSSSSVYKRGHGFGTTFTATLLLRFARDSTGCSFLLRAP